MWWLERLCHITVNKYDSGYQFKGQMEFELSAGNVVIGTFTFAFISLPEGWVIKKSESPLDINYTTRTDKLGWVLDGNARYYAVNLVGEEALELEVTCRKAATPSQRSGEYLTTKAGGHEAYFAVRAVKVGLFKKKQLKQLNISLSCDVTRRILEFSFTGPGSWVEDILALVSSYRCH